MLPSICVYTINTAYSYHVCIYLWWRSCGRVCGLLLSGSTNQPSDNGSHYFCIIRLQVSKQPLFNHRKQNMRGREWLLMIICVCVRETHTQGQPFIYIYSKPGIWQQWDTFQMSLYHFCLSWFKMWRCVSVRGERCSWRVAASSDSKCEVVSDPLGKLANWEESLSDVYDSERHAVLT